MFDRSMQTSYSSCERVCVHSTIALVSSYPLDGIDTVRIYQLH